MNRPVPEVELSDQGMEYFNVFFKLCSFRSQDMGGPGAILPGTIADWCNATSNHMEPWELELIMEMDLAYLKKMRHMMELHREADRQRQKGYKTNGHSDDRL